MLYFEHFRRFSLLSGSCVTQCGAGTAMLVSKNTDVMRSRDCSPQETGSLTAMLSAVMLCAASPHRGTADSHLLQVIH